MGFFQGGVENQIFPRAGQQYLGGAFGSSPLPEAGILAALDMKTNRLVWRQAWKDACYSGSVTTAGSVFAGMPRGNSVWPFSLKGTMEQAAPALTNAPAGTADATAPDLARGERIFRDACSTCHGGPGEGGHGGPALSGARNLGSIARIIQQGGTQMPSLSSSLTARDIRDVSAYVREKLVR